MERNGERCRVHGIAACTYYGRHGEVLNHAHQHVQDYRSQCRPPAQVAADVLLDQVRRMSLARSGREVARALKRAREGDPAWRTIVGLLIPRRFFRTFFADGHDGERRQFVQYLEAWVRNPNPSTPREQLTMYLPGRPVILRWTRPMDTEHFDISSYRVGFLRRLLIHRRLTAGELAYVEKAVRMKRFFDDAEEIEEELWGSQSDFQSLAERRRRRKEMRRTRNNNEDDWELEELIQSGRLSDPDRGKEDILTEALHGDREYRVTEVKANLQRAQSIGAVEKMEEIINVIQWDNNYHPYINDLRRHAMLARNRLAGLGDWWWDYED